MADVKISALPAATTPLDGTELAPIVQSGTTKRVTVANLTAGRAISASSLTLTTPLSVANGGTGITSFGAGVATALGNAVNGASGICVQDASGNLGLGVTPSAWGSVYLKAIQLGTQGVYIAGNTASYSGSSYTYLGNNGYLDSAATFKYTVANAAAQYVQFNGEHQWLSAASGSAGSAISFTQALTLTAGGNLLVGGTSDPGGTQSVYIANTGSVPGTPSSGGVLYVESGALKYKGSSGTVTTLGAA